MFNLPDPPLTCHKDEGIEEIFEIFRVAWCLDAPQVSDGDTALDDEDCSTIKEFEQSLNLSNY